MFFIKRAFKYLKKKKGKTFLIGIIFIVIANFVLAGMLVQNATKKAQEDTRIKIGAEINYRIDTAAVFDAVDRGAITFNQQGGIRFAMGQGVTTNEDFTKQGAPTYYNFVMAAESDYVKTYDGSVAYDLTATGLKAYSQGANNNSDTFNVKLFMAAMPNDFEEENAILESGRFATESEIQNGASVILIEKTTADANNLSLGDKISTVTTILDYKDIEIDYEIIGIFETQEEVDQRMAARAGASILPQNRFYAPFSSIKNVGLTNEEIDNLVLTTAIINLKDPLDVEIFKEEAALKIDLKLGMLDANDALFKSLMGPVETLGSISKILVAIIAIAGALIIGLITALSINERKEEIGILLAVGEGKIKVISQLVLEVVIIAVITFSLSTFSGSFIGKTISDKVLGSGILEAQTNNTVTIGNMQVPRNRLPGRFGGGGGGGNNSRFQDLNANKAEAVDISLEFGVLMQLFALGILMAIVSTIVPSMHVMRFNPKQILINRNS
jgi:putative ABC transport system permease protein